MFSKICSWWAIAHWWQPYCQSSVGCWSFPECSWPSLVSRVLNIKLKGLIFIKLATKATFFYCEQVSQSNPMGRTSNQYTSHIELIRQTIDLSWIAPVLHMASGIVTANLPKPYKSIMPSNPTIHDYAQLVGIIRQSRQSALSVKENTSFSMYNYSCSRAPYCRPRLRQMISLETGLFQIATSTKQ